MPSRAISTQKYSPRLSDWFTSSSECTMILTGRLMLARSEEHTSELQSLMRISYAVFCLKKKKNTTRLHQSAEKKVKQHVTNQQANNEIHPEQKTKKEHTH